MMPALFSYCTVIYAPPKLKNHVCRVDRMLFPCSSPCVWVSSQSAWSNNTTETPTFIISRYLFRYAIPEHYQYLYALRSILSIIIDCYIIKEDTWPNKNNFPEIFQVSFALCPICIGKVPSLNRCNYGLLCVTQQ